MIGRSLAHYEISGLLGKGGMGEVYRARDTRLGREVALKRLPDELAADPERRARFEREARTLASLQHPNVASLYGYEQADGQHFLTMELVEGAELAALLDQGPLPIGRALDIARQVATGLEAAHARGIVHRDLKPQNIRIDPEGVAKILDFGLALPRAADEEALADSPTITAALTQAGTLLGTAAYMSPEQASGRPVDARADIWAFGVILFEMLSGKRLFQEESIGETLAAVIRAEPDWDALPAGLSPGVHRLLRRCLRKKPRQRLHSIADARLELEELDDPAAAPVVVGAQSWRPLAMGLLPALLVGALLGWWFAPRGDAGTAAADRPLVRSQLPLPAGTQLAGWASPVVALSPDGRHVAFVAQHSGGQQLYLRALDEEEAVVVPESDGAEGPFFSPDGRWVGFGAGGISGRSAEPRTLKKYSLETGRTEVVCALEDYFGGVWREDGTIFYLGLLLRGVQRVPAEGGSPFTVAAADSQRYAMAFPQLLPSGQELLYTRWGGEELGEIMVFDLATGERRELGVAGSYARWSPTGHLLVARGEELWAHRFDPATVRLGEGRARVIEGITISGNAAAVFALAGDGTMVHARGAVDGARTDLSRLWWVTPDGERTPFELEPQYFRSFAFSPDGRRLFCSVFQGGSFVLDLQRGTQLALPAGEALGRRSVHWTPSGDGIVFTAPSGERVAGLNLWLQPVDGVSPPRRLEAREGEFFASGWVPGTRQLLHSGFEVARGVEWRLYLLDLDDSTPRPRVLLDAGENPGYARVSPDGRWMAYRASEGGGPRVYLRSWPDLARKVPVAAGSSPEWSADGSRLLFSRRGDGGLESVWSVALDGAGQPGPPRLELELQDALDWEYDAANDRHLVTMDVPGSGEIHQLELVQGWFAELELLLPAGRAP